MSPRPALGGSAPLWVVVPLWNQWPMTQAFFESLEAAAPRGGWRLLAVDNGSGGETAAGLRAWRRRLPLQVIRNRRNRGVAPAWNQGLRAALRGGARWVGFFNNDLLLAPGSLERLLRQAERSGWDAVSPATREGALGYDLGAYAAAYLRRCGGRRAEGLWFGWCFLVRREVFAELGGFDEGFRLGVGEDEDFFRRLKAAGFRCGVTGGAFVHHFGSATLGPLRRRLGKAFEEANMARLRGRWGLARAPRWRRWALSAGRLWERLRWGHGLKE